MKHVDKDSSILDVQKYDGKSFNRSVTIISQMEIATNHIFQNNRFLTVLFSKLNCLKLTECKAYH